MDFYQLLLIVALVYLWQGALTRLTIAAVELAYYWARYHITRLTR